MTYQVLRLFNYTLKISISMEVMKHFLLIKIKHIYNFAYVRLMPLEEG